jgi:hypothetical protein
MGHKAHPIGLRLGIHRKWKSNWFFESKNYPKFIHLNLNIEKFFKGFLYFYNIKTLLLNCQLVKLATNQIFIFIFYYRFRKKLKKSLYKWKVKKWKSHLERHLLKKTQFLNYQFVQAKFQNSLIKNFKLSQEKLNFFSFLIKKNIFEAKPIFRTNTFWTINNNIKQLKVYIQFLTQIQKKFTISKVFLFKLKLQLRYLQLNLNYNKCCIEKNIFKAKKQLFLLKNIFFFYNSFFKKNLIPLTKGPLEQKYQLNLIKFIRKLFFIKLYYNFYLKKYAKKSKLKNKKRYILSNKNLYYSLSTIKKFLTKITNSKIKLIFINTLSFTKFIYLIEDSKKKKKEKFNILQIQKIMLNKFKYNAIFIKDFVHLSFIALLLKNTSILTSFIGEQFKRLPKNRKQLKLLAFINQTLKIFCQQRKEFIGFKLQIQGRLNRRNRTHKWTFQNGILPIQTYKTRVEYGYSEGLTRSGLIGIKLWIFYQKLFKNFLKRKILQYLYYSKNKKFFIQPLLQINNYVKTKPTKISKK